MYIYHRRRDGAVYLCMTKIVISCITNLNLLSMQHAAQQERGQFPRVSKLYTTAHFLGHYLEMHIVSQFLVHFVHLSRRAQLAHSAFCCCAVCLLQWSPVWFSILVTRHQLNYILAHIVLFHNFQFLLFAYFALFTSMYIISLVPRPCGYVTSIHVFQETQTCSEYAWYEVVKRKMKNKMDIKPRGPGLMNSNH